jgi:hypothetical protein
MPNIAVEQLALLLCSRGVWGSTLGPEISHPDARYDSIVYAI